jgi:outer membrane protein TolC
MHYYIKRILPVTLAALTLVFSTTPSSAAPTGDTRGTAPMYERSEDERTEGVSEIRLSLQDGIYEVLRNNLDITIERITPEISEAAVTTQQGAFDVEAFGSFMRRESTEPLSSRSSVAAGGLTSIDTETYELNTGLTARTGLGTTYTIEFEESWTDDSFTQTGFEYTSFTGLRITQPVLKDFGGAASRVDLEIARKDRDISGHRFTGLVIDTLSDFELKYWDLVLARETLKVREESGRLAETLLDRDLKKLRAGVLSPLEVAQAEAAVAARREEIIVAASEVRERENALKLLISRDVITLKDTAIIPTEPLRIKPIEASVEDGFKSAVTSRPDYLEAKDDIEKSGIRVLYAKNQRLPSVDIEASYGFNGLGTDFGGALEGIDSNPEWSLGVVMRYPLGNRAGEGELRTARLEASQTLLRLKRLEQMMILNIDGAVKDLESNKERIEAAVSSVRLARRALEAEEKRLDAGRSTTFNVLQLQEDLVKARLNELSAIVDYNKAAVRYIKERGTLLTDLGQARVEAISRGPLKTEWH